MTGDRRVGDLSMAELLDVWQEWNLADFGNTDTDAAAAVDALAALAANDELARRLGSWQWHAVFAARRHGMTWEQVGDVLHRTGGQARADYLDRIETAEQWAPQFTDTAAYRTVLDDTPTAADACRDGRP